MSETIIIEGKLDLTELEELRRLYDVMSASLNDLDARLLQIESAHGDHKDRLDVHDIKFANMEDSLRELRSRIHQMQADVFRLADAATSNALTTEGQAKALRVQNASLANLLKLQHEILDRLKIQPTVTLP